MSRRSVDKIVADLLWNTLERDVPQLGTTLRDWALDGGVDLT
ncbi:MAG TPA: hypothetical protein VF148_16425 [Acidimicrobiia bacterium]